MTKPKANIVVGDALGPNNPTPLETGRWLNDIKLDAVTNAKLDAEQFDQDQQSIPRGRRALARKQTKAKRP